MKQKKNNNNIDCLCVEFEYGMFYMFLVKCWSCVKSLQNLQVLMHIEIMPDAREMVETQYI